MAQLHTWAGLLPGWLLFIIFLFGTTAFFQQEVSRWMRPELGGGGATSVALDNASAYLSTNAPNAENWNIVLPSGRGGEPISLSWKPREGSTDKAGEATLDPATGQTIDVRDTSGGWFLYRMHFDLHYMPWWLARYLVCAAALAMVVAILSGIVTHRKIFADFFLLRFNKGQRSWLDAHNATAVLALPFHLMITYTGLVTLMFMAMPWALDLNFPDRSNFYQSTLSVAPHVQANDQRAKMMPLSALVARSEAVTGSWPGSISIENPGRAAATVRVFPVPDRLGGDMEALSINGVTGAHLQPRSPIGGARATQRTMIDLHAGRFSDPTLRWLYFLSGIGGTVMIATGLVLWTVKRRAKLPDPARPYFGFRLVERLNIGIIAGAPAGIAVYFVANRLLPLGMANRADWEINSLFIAWGGVIVWTLARPAKWAWVEALAVCAALYVLVPVVNAFSTARGMVPSLIARDWVFVGFDSVMLAMASACAFTAWKVATHKAKPALRRKARMAMEAAL